MSSSYAQVDVLCPFYLRDNGRDIIECEGIIEGSKIKNYFWKKGDYGAQIRAFCCAEYKNCEIYKTLMKKYEEGDDL